MMVLSDADSLGKAAKEFSEKPFLGASLGSSSAPSSDEPSKHRLHRGHRVQLPRYLFHSRPATKSIPLCVLRHIDELERLSTTRCAVASR